MSDAAAIPLRSSAADFRLGVLLVAGSAIFKAKDYAEEIKAIRTAATSISA